MRISAKTDYAIRAATELAASHASGPVPAESIATAQDIPARFLLAILADLRRHGIVASRRGAEGGWLLARPATEITIADIIRAVDGPLAGVAGVRPEQLTYHGSAAPLQELWIAVRHSLRDVLEAVTVGDLAGGRLPAPVTRLTRDPDDWQPH